MSQVHGTLDRAALESELVRDEGLRLRPYVDTVGKVTVGVGRNLTDVGLTREEAVYLFRNDVDHVLSELPAALPWWPALDGVRQRVLANMAFNLGVPKLLTFHDTLHAVADGDYGRAADHMLASLWAKQVGARAVRLAALMRTGGVQ